MTSFIIDLENDLFGFAEESESIALDSDQINQALELSQDLNQSTQRWQIYLQLLALFGFENWLSKREPELRIMTETASVMTSAYANILDAVFNVEVGEFKVCLIPTIDCSEPEVNIPRAILDLPEFTAHFYILIGLDETSELAVILGFIRYDQLNASRAQLQPQTDWNYCVPREWFNPKVDELLLYLQCLIPAIIPLPATPSNRQSELYEVRDQLQSQLQQLPSYPLWNTITWEQGRVLLIYPELLNWLHDSNSENVTQQSNYLSDLLRILTQQAVNVVQWLQSQVNDLEQELSWEPVPIGAFRGEQRQSSFLPDEILTEIPEDAACAYQDFLSQIRLYTFSWLLPNTEREWTLLLIVAAISEQTSVSEIQLRISDRSQILVEESFNPEQSPSYLLAQIEGTDDEQFLVTLSTADGELDVSQLFEYRN